MCHKRDLTDQQWKILDPLVPEPARRRDGRGRPWKERRAVLNGILWVLRTGAPWVELPDRADTISAYRRPGRAHQSRTAHYKKLGRKRVNSLLQSAGKLHCPLRRRRGHRHDQAVWF